MNYPTTVLHCTNTICWGKHEPMFYGKMTKKTIYEKVKDGVFEWARSKILLNVSVFEEHVNVTVVTFRVYVKDHVNEWSFGKDSCSQSSVEDFQQFRTTTYVQKPWIHVHRVVFTISTSSTYPTWNVSSRGVESELSLPWLIRTEIN